jgi:hypothetical protein
MPCLNSGRQFALGRPSLIDRLKFGTDAEIYALMIAYRLEVAQPQDLVSYLPVVYFRTEEGMPPNAPRYLSGHTVRAVLDGKAGWSESELVELQQWLRSDAAIRSWVEGLFAEVNDIIRSSPIWSSGLVTDEPEHRTKH